MSPELRDALHTIVQDPIEFGCATLAMAVAYTLALRPRRATGAPDARVALWLPALVWLAAKQVRRVISPQARVLHDAGSLVGDVFASLAFTPVWLAVYALAIFVAERSLRRMGPRIAGAAWPRIGVVTILAMLFGYGVDAAAAAWLGLWSFGHPDFAFDGTAASLHWLLPNRLVSGLAFFSAHYAVLLPATTRAHAGARRRWTTALLATVWVIAISNLWRPLDDIGLALLLAGTIGSLFVWRFRLPQDPARTLPST